MMFLSRLHFEDPSARRLHGINDINHQTGEEIRLVLRQKITKFEGNDVGVRHVLHFVISLSRYSRGRFFLSNGGSQLGS